MALFTCQSVAFLMESAKPSKAVRAPEAAARAADIVIAEVGAWSNPLSPDDETRAEALEKCKKGNNSRRPVAGGSWALWHCKRYMQFVDL